MVKLIIGDKGIAISALILILTMTSQASNPLDAIASQVGMQANIVPQNLTEKTVEHFSQVNLTQEHLQQDFNATKGQIKQKAEEMIKQQVNNTTEQIQQKAKEEINKQVNKSFQQPDFELIFALGSILLIAYFSRRYLN
ncbi:MAG: hypothetical protein ACE14P_13750 [Methanotrichaceae archaeon]